MLMSLILLTNHFLKPMGYVVMYCYHITCDAHQNKLSLNYHLLLDLSPTCKSNPITFEVKKFMQLLYTNIS